MAEEASAAGMGSCANLNVPWHNGQLGPPAFVDEPQPEIKVSHVENPEFEMNSPLKHSGAPSHGLKSVAHQHPLWLTFLDSDMEEQFGVWMGQKCSKVRCCPATTALIALSGAQLY